MKRFIKIWMGLFLACILVISMPVSVSASEMPDSQNASDTQDKTRGDGESQNTGDSRHTEDEPDNQEPKDSGDTADLQDIKDSKDISDGKDSKDVQDTGSKDQEQPSENKDEDKKDQKEGSVLEEKEDNGDTGALEQEGEVTEPITKEDKPFLALGANLTAAQQATVLELLGINPAELGEYDVVYVTNDDEHNYLGEYVSADKIGTRSLSSVLVVKRDKGHGINITTKNISYCTIGMYKNALITAGITDADILVAGPTPISGTAALVGALKAYSVMTGEEVTEESMDAALNELVLTGDIAGIVGDAQKAEELLAYLKQQIIEHDLDSEEEMEDAVKEACATFDISLNQAEVDELVKLLMKIKDLDLDLDSIMSQAKSLYDKLSELGEGQGFFDKVAGFFQSILDFFKSLF